MAIVVLRLAAEHRLYDTVEQNLPGLLPRLRAGTRHSGEESGPTPRTLPTRTSGITDCADHADATTRRPVRTSTGHSRVEPFATMNGRAGNGDPAPGHSFE
ncbi:hypothetical protein [Streptomyces sp. BK022]|uniref:hypothetical protein n=1 Tax=Streptomyces sp. BK022 TaxID=2512123 RepID=UPI001028D809|nr:hypothetical protein [Streptomyces sp. BK022]